MILIEARHLGSVSGMHPADVRQTAREQIARAIAERRAAFVVHERVVGDEVHEAGVDRALAEVVLLAISASERLGVEPADRMSRPGA